MLLLFEQAEQGVEAGSEVTAGLGWDVRGLLLREVLLLDALAGAVERLEYAVAIEGLEQVIDRIHVEGAHGVLVECSGEDDLRHGGWEIFLSSSFLMTAKPSRPGICTSRKTRSG